MVLLSKVFEQHYFKSHNSPKSHLTNNRSLWSNSVEIMSFLESNSPGIFTLCKKNLDGTVAFSIFSVKSKPPLIETDSAIHTHGRPFYVRGDFSLNENSPYNILTILHRIYAWLLL